MNHHICLYIGGAACALSYILGWALCDQAHKWRTARIVRRITE